MALRAHILSEKNVLGSVDLKGKASRQTLFEGAFILMIGGILVKIIGAMFKIPLQNLIGATGTAYFSVAYDIYTWMYIITTAGLPVAISRMVSESNAHGRYGDSRRTLQVAFRGFVIIGAVASLAMFFGAGLLANALKSPNSKYAIMAIAPAIFFEVVMSCYRGYTQGFKNMIPTAISQIIVAVVKLIAGILCTLFVLDRLGNGEEAIPYAAAAAIFGVTLGCALGAVYIVLANRRTDAAIQQKSVLAQTPRMSLFKKLLVIAIPITIGSSVLSITNLVDTAMLFRRLLAAGFDQATTDFMYGAYGWARTMFNLPTAVIVPLGVAVVPAITEQYTLRRFDEAKLTIESTLRMAALMALPSGLGLAVLSGPILHLLYPAQPDAASFAAPLLTALGPAVVLVCMVSITNALLQAMGRECVPIFTMLIGGALKIACNYILVGNPQININGAPVGTNLCYGAITVLNLIVICRALGRGVNIGGIFVKPLLASAGCCAGAYLTNRLLTGALGNTLSCLLSIAVAGVIYIVLLCALKALRREDIKLLPKAEKIEKILDKCGWIS